MDRRKKNVEIFMDSMKWIAENQKLKDACMKSLHSQELFLEKDPVGNSKLEKRFADTEVVVSRERSLAAAVIPAYLGKKVCVLNFASATTPGGGVNHGSSAQEESLCRCSTLYPCLNTKGLFERFYSPHRQAGNPLNNADCIYTPGVVVFKNDCSFPERMEESDWYEVDVITCAAPNLNERKRKSYCPETLMRYVSVSDEELWELHRKRIERIFEIAALHQEDVLVLGAFGCGAFHNPPRIVASAYASVQEMYRGYFEAVKYAVYYRDYESENFDVFCLTCGMGWGKNKTRL